jgi:hypothetical protein
MKVGIIAVVSQYLMMGVGGWGGNSDRINDSTKSVVQKVVLLLGVGRGEVGLGGGQVGP